MPASPATTPPADSHHLRKTLGPVMLWGLGVGYVISGEYFGWNLGLPLGGTYGMLASFLLISLMYVAFVFSYTEMACAIPRAGGVFVYGVRALGLPLGYLGGIAQIIEFVFAPPAIAVAIGEYININYPAADPRYVALAAYLAFTLLNIVGVRQAATFELVVTILAVGELLLFVGVTAPHFRIENFTADAWPNGWSGAFASIPFAIWFYLAIEGVANAAEESRNPQRDVVIGFGAAITTLVVLAAAVFVFSVGVGGWQHIVYEPEHIQSAGDTLVVASDAPTTDKPLPLALGQIVARDHPLYRLLVGIGLLGLVASFNGIILIAGRALFEMGRVGFLPAAVGHTFPRTGTPAVALIANMVFGMLAILFLPTGDLITMSALGAVTLYIVAMIALIRLRRVEPDLPRPYRTPFYPALPVVALLIAILSLATMLYFNFNYVAADSPLDALRETAGNSITLWYLAFLLIAMLYYFLAIRTRLSQSDIEHFKRID